MEILVRRLALPDEELKQRIHPNFRHSLLCNWAKRFTVKGIAQELPESAARELLNQISKQEHIETKGFTFKFHEWTPNAQGKWGPALCTLEM